MNFLQVGEHVINLDTVAHIRFRHEPTGAVDGRGGLKEVTGSRLDAVITFVGAQPKDDLLQLRLHDENAETLQRYITAQAVVDAT
jgi:hypothetical protein